MGGGPAALSAAISAEMAAPAALHEAAIPAPNRIAQFTDGDLLLDDAPLNRFAQSAWK